MRSTPTLFTHTLHHKSPTHPFSENKSLKKPLATICLKEVFPDLFWVGFETVAQITALNPSSSSLHNNALVPFTQNLTFQSMSQFSPLIKQPGNET